MENNNLIKDVHIRTHKIRQWVDKAFKEGYDREISLSEAISSTRGLLAILETNLNRLALEQHVNDFTPVPGKPEDRP